MRTKTLLLTAAMGSWVATSVAQNSFSVNVVGYVNLTFKAGMNLFANPLDNADGNGVENLLPELPFGSEIFRFTGAGYESTQWLGPGIASATDPNQAWTDPSFELNPGEGFFLRNDGAETTVTFVGEVPLGVTNVDIPTNLSILASPVPQDLNGPDNTLLTADFPAGSGDTAFYLNDTQDGFNSTVYQDIGAPDLLVLPDGANRLGAKVGEAFFYDNQGSARTWGRDFQLPE